jgi:hypothetical protein
LKALYLKGYINGHPVNKMLVDIGAAVEELKELEDDEAMAKGRKDDAVAIGLRKEMDA